MNAILDAAKRMRVGSVLSAAMLATGCAEKTEQPFVDPQFELIMLLDGPDPPCDCGERVYRFGGVITYHEASGAWLNGAGDLVDLSEAPKTDHVNYRGHTVVRLHPNISFAGLQRAIASLAEAGICRFGRIALKNVEKQAETDPDGIALYDSYGEETVLKTRVYAFRLEGEAPLLCKEGATPEPTTTGYSKHSSFLQPSDF